jgi:hypothetical protein
MPEREAGVTVAIWVRRPFSYLTDAGGEVIFVDHQRLHDVPDAVARQVIYRGLAL